MRVAEFSGGFSLGKFLATNNSLTVHDVYLPCLSQNCIVENRPTVMSGEIDIQAFLTSLADHDLASAQHSLQLNHLWFFQTPEFASEPLSK